MVVTITARKLPHKWQNIAKSACQTQALRSKIQLKKNIRRIHTFQHVRPQGNKLPHNAKDDCKSDACRKNHFRGGLAMQCSAEVTCFLTILRHPNAPGSAIPTVCVRSTIIGCIHADVLIFALWCKLDLAFIVC